MVIDRSRDTLATCRIGTPTMENHGSATDGYSLFVGEHMVSENYLKS